MVARGGGTIINVTTMAAEFGMPGLSAYGASKAALALLTKAWAASGRASYVNGAMIHVGGGRVAV